MNFLESLAAEWYEYTGHLVRTNVRTGKRASGGWEGELDVLAYDPKSKTLRHIELSSDAFSWEKRKDRFLTKKLVLDDAEYANVFGLPIETVERIVVVGTGQEAKFDLNWGRGIRVVLIPQFLQQVAASLRGVDPMSKAVPEGFAQTADPTTTDADSSKPSETDSSTNSPAPS